MSRGSNKASDQGTASGLPSDSTAAVDAVPAFFDQAEELLTEAGLANAYVELLNRLRAGGTRDEVSAMVGEKHVLQAFERLQDKRAERGAVAELLRELRETQRLVKSQQGSASTSFEHRPPIPHEDGRDPN